jgi:flavodoxin
MSIKTWRTGMNDSKVTQKKLLIAYFSHSGNTRTIAEMIQKQSGGEIFEIKAVKIYPEDYDTVVEEAKKELKSGFKPELRTKIVDMSQYEPVFIGYPNWWGTFPAPVKTFLLEHDLTGKTIIPFCTHEGSGLGRSTADISKMCPKSKVADGIAIWGSEVSTTKNKVSEWLSKIKIIK